MGEVYRARDPRLNREVAIKVLPANYASDAERLKRFEQEAIASSALNHPNILTVYDFGTHQGSPYIVTELLEGQELGTILTHGAVPVRKAMEYARQIAAGLAAAHEKGIIHRDLKPANLFVKHDGHVKILDFGLAKLNPAGAAAWGAAATVGGTMDSAPANTAAGVVLGTAGYMSPEQVRGAATDHRSDIFAFGTVLYEMLSGCRAFKGGTAVETMTAILNDDPPDLSPSSLRISPALDRIVRRCLEKEPDQRFQSAKDLAFALEALSGGSETRPSLPLTPRRKLRWIWLAAASVALAAIAAVLFANQRRGFSIPTRIVPLSYRDGYVRMARFAPDGQSIVYGAMWDGGPMQLYAGSIDSPAAHSIDPSKADLLAVSSTGELAVALNRRFVEPWIPIGTLARVPAQGGTPREVAVGALDADWSPDGSSLVYSTRAHGKFQLRLLPSGRVLYETAGYISHMRFSPDGKRVAFMDHPIYGDDRGTVAVVDMEGNKKTLTPEYTTEQGLAWTPDGREIWFTANPALDWSLWATTLDGKQREIVRDVALLTLQDISRDGRVLVTSFTISSQVIAGGATGPESRNLVTYQWGNVVALSADGQKAAITEFNASPSTDYGLYIRNVDGSPGTALGEGRALDFSPNGKSVLAYLPSQNDKLMLIPTGVGETRTLPSVGLHYQDGVFLPDGRRLVVIASEQGKAGRIYLQNVEGTAPPRPITPEGIAPSSMVVSPDGKWVTALIAGSKDSEEGLEQVAMMYPIDGDAPPRPVKGVDPEDTLVQWLNDGKLLVAPRGEVPLEVFKLDPATGKRELWRRFAPSDPNGVFSFRRVYVTRDAKRYIYETRRVMSNLWVLEGLK